MIADQTQATCRLGGDVDRLDGPPEIVPRGTRPRGPADGALGDVKKKAGERGRVGGNLRRFNPAPSAGPGWVGGVGNRAARRARRNDIR